MSTTIPCGSSVVLAHSFRKGRFSAERTYSLGPEALEWDAGGRRRRVPYADFVEIRFGRYRVRGAGAATQGSMWRGDFRYGAFRKITLLPTHHGRAGGIEDRSSSCYELSRQLAAHITAANPAAKIRFERRW